MGLFKGKPKRGLKHASMKRVSYLERRKRSIYSPSPSPICKRFKTVNLIKSADVKTSSHKKRRQIFTPCKSSQKRIHFLLDNEIGICTISPMKSSSKKVTSQKQCSKSNDQYKDQVYTISGETSTDKLLKELECTNIQDDDEFQDESVYSDNTLPKGFTMPQEIVDDLNARSDLTFDEFQGNDLNSEESKLQDLLPSVVQEFKKHDKSDVLVQFFQLVAEKKFPMKNISFLMWCDLVRWFSETDTRGMRYSPECMEFFWVGRKLFGGRFLRYMSGLRNEGEMIKGGNAFNPESSRINFACPTLPVLLNFKPMGEELPAIFKPGLMQEMIAYKAQKDTSATDKSYVLMLDGKKMKRSTDVDLLGFEPGETLKEKQDEKERKESIINNCIDKITYVQDSTNTVSETSEKDKHTVFATLLSLVLLFSTVLKEVRNLRVKKEYSLNKLKELGGFEWRKSKYCYSIDLNMTLIWKIDNCIDKCLKILKVICKTGAYLNKVGQLFANEPVVNLNCQSNLRILKSVEKLPHNDQTDTSIIKQRSEKWFKDREDMKVTGSTIYPAIGLDSLKRQKEHFDRRVHGVEPPEFSEAQQKAMEHGTKTEVHHLATMCGVILPFLYPDSVFYEEGYYIEDNVLVSPDGSVRSSDGKPMYAFEGKSPIPKSHVPTLHEAVPVRYVTQTLYEARVLKTEGTLYLCWTDKSCSLFKVPFNEDLCRDINQEIESVYLVENPKRPSKLSHNSKTIKDAVSKHAADCIFLGEFPSVQGRFENASLLITDDMSSPYETQSEPKSSIESLTYDDLQRGLLLGKEVIAESYELQRIMGTQVVVYLLADLDRYWKEEQPHAIPVLYFYRGYSLSMETTRQINENCKTACREEGLDVIVTAADGEFNTIMGRGRDNKPLTQHQLSKDVWKDVCKYSKAQIIQIFLQKSKPIVPRNETLGSEEGNILETDGGTMKGIKTPSKGWVIQTAKRQREEPEITPIEQEQEYNTITVLEEVDETEEPEAHMDKTDEIELSQSEVQLNMNDICEGLERVNPVKWTDITHSDIADIFQSADSLNKLTVKELTEIAKCLNRRQTDNKLHIKISGVIKHQLVNSISKQFGDGSQIAKKVSAKKRNVQPLKQLAQRVVMKKTYPKRVLNIALANFLWSDKLREWKEHARVGQTIDIIDVSQDLSPYYVPDKSQDGDFEVFVYDKTHLGSNLRKAICLNKVSGVSKKAWDKVSRMSPEILNPLLVEVSAEGKIADQMKERFARNMVSDDVEKCMIENGNMEEANFCEVIREGLYEADDTPGIPAIERCEKRLKLINWLDNGVDCGDFPPYGASIKGLSTILYEGLRSSSEAKLYLYALAKNGTYCVRAPNTLCSESFFSTMQEMDPWGQGVLTADGIEKHISDFTAITAMKMKEDRSFYINTKRDKVYPVPTVSSIPGENRETATIGTCSCRKDGFIRCIIPKDHFFDTEARIRGHRRRTKKPLTFSEVNDPLRGDQPVRARYGYKINESKILTSKRIGVDFNDK